MASALERLLKRISGDATSPRLPATRSQPISSFNRCHHRSRKRPPAVLAEASWAMRLSKHDVSQATPKNYSLSIRFCCYGHQSLRHPKSKERKKYENSRFRFENAKAIKPSQMHQGYSGCVFLGLLDQVFFRGMFTSHVVFFF